jgi:hypothetical protein
LGTWVFCFANKQYKLGTKFLLFFLVLNFLLYAPWLGITNFSTIGSAGDTLRLVFLGFSIWLGIRGQEIVWKSGVWQTQEEFMRKQKFAAKLVAVYFITLLVISLVSFGLLLKPYIQNPELIDQKIMSEALIEARKTNPDINTTEFESGYKMGINNGQNIEAQKTFVANQSSSYQNGYRYGYIISCVKKNTQEVCLKKILE